MARLLSVNVGVPRPDHFGSQEMTAIDKRPVDGPVAISAPGPKGTGAVGVAGDRVFDVKDHGGDDQAVYAYAREDLDWWAAQLDRELPGGVFGENLTTLGLDVTGAVIGERWRIGPQVVLEVTAPRIPCATFRGWIGVKGWVKRFAAHGAPGAYLRVVDAGEVSAGDPIMIVAKPADTPTIGAVFRSAMRQN
jgi:MOSC domain-containing protein YiiM